VGQLGEDIATRYLKKKRYKIIERNYRETWGELDVIALSPDKTLVFVEVKTVTGPFPYVEPEEHLTQTKLIKLQRTANLYANKSPYLKDNKGWQIDLITIVMEGDDAIVKHYKNI